MPTFNGTLFSRITKKEGLPDDRVRILYYSKKVKSVMAGTYKGLTIIRMNEVKVPALLKDDFITGIVDAGAFFYISTNSKHNPVRFYTEKDIFIRAGDGGL